MTLRTQVLVWVGLFLATILLLWVFRSILLPFVIGIALAYLLNPLVTWLQKIVASRSWATAIVLLFVLALIVGFLLMLVPLVGNQLIDMIARLPRYIGDLQQVLQDLAPQLTTWLGSERAAQLEGSLTELIGRGVEIAGSITAIIATSGLNVLNTIAVLFIAPVVAFYLLLDWEGMVKRVDDLLPRQHRDEIRGVLHDIDRSMAGVIRGQGSVILVLTIYYSTALSLAGLNFGLAIGLIGGLLSFIPYVGFLTGFVLSMAVAVVQFWPDDWLFIVIVFVVYMVGQFLEGNVLYPKLVGQSININPVWLMFALFAFALLFGFVGLLLAVPLAAIAGVLTRYALRKYQESSLYLGTTTTPSQAAAAAAEAAA
ncbi:MAG TPA: AI-2E family transporter, partial [Alphaproteobacteria bacterium]|nr:AI-2E family transporter [Alphaproteobacteria bacterium]